MGSFSERKSCINEKDSLTQRRGNVQRQLSYYFGGGMSARTKRYINRTARKENERAVPPLLPLLLKALDLFQTSQVVTSREIVRTATDIPTLLVSGETKHEEDLTTESNCAASLEAINHLSEVLPPTELTLHDEERANRLLRIIRDRANDDEQEAC